MFITFNKGLFIWIAPKPRRWLLCGLFHGGFVWHWHCCTRDRPDASEIRDIIDMMVRHSRGFRLRITRSKRPDQTIPG